jgi:hypothetical protein
MYTRTRGDIPGGRAFETVFGERLQRCIEQLLARPYAALLGFSRKSLCTGAHPLALFHSSPGQEYRTAAQIVQSGLFYVWEIFPS